MDAGTPPPRPDEIRAAAAALKTRPDDGQAGLWHYSTALWHFFNQIKGVSVHFNWVIFFFLRSTVFACEGRWARALKFELVFKSVCFFSCG